LETSGSSLIRAEGQPLVSVIVPCYNYADYIGDALRSVFSQCYENFELIVVDDGSTDNSADVIEQVLQGLSPARRLKRVVFIKQENQGVSAALNAGLALANGVFVATFDADDVMPSGRLALQAAYLNSHPEVGVLGGLAVRIDEHGALLPKKQKSRKIRRYDFEQALTDALVVGGNIAMYRRDAMDAVGGYDPQIKIQDFQMTLKIAHAGYFIDVLPEVVTLYRKHGDSLSKNYKAELRYSMEVIEPYAQFKGYPSARARLITKALRLAVLHDKSYAWGLFRQVPLRQWDRQLFKRFRHFIFKRSRPGPAQTLV